MFFVFGVFGDKTSTKVRYIDEGVFFDMCSCLGCVSGGDLLSYGNSNPRDESRRFVHDHFGICFETFCPTLWSNI